MNLIERWFNVSPDAGNGSLEILIFIAVAVGTWLLWRKFKRPVTPDQTMAPASAMVTFSRTAWKVGTRWARVDFALVQCPTRPRGDMLLDSPGK